MSSRKPVGWLLLLAVIATVALVASGIPTATSAGEQTIYMSAVEYKGGANISSEPYPPAEEPGTLPLDPVGDPYGYRLKEPDSTGRWEVSSYRFEPGFLVLRRGVRTTLEIAGINGAHHEAHLTNPAGDVRKEFVITRGRLTRVTFTPWKTGVWTLHCETHQPGMTGQFLVI